MARNYKKKTKSTVGSIKMGEVSSGGFVKKLQSMGIKANPANSAGVLRKQLDSLDDRDISFMSDSLEVLKVINGNNDMTSEVVEPEVTEPEAPVTTPEDNEPTGGETDPTTTEDNEPEE